MKFIKQCFQYFSSFRLETDHSMPLKVSVSHYSHGVMTPVNGDFSLSNINLFGLILTSSEAFQIGQEIQVNLKLKRFFSRFDLKINGVIQGQYGKLDEEHKFYFINIEKNLELSYFVKDLVNNFSRKALENLFKLSVLSEKHLRHSEVLELCHLAGQQLLSDLTELKSSEMNGFQHFTLALQKLLEPDQIKIYAIDGQHHRFQCLYPHGDKSNEMKNLYGHYMSQCLFTKKVITHFIPKVEDNDVEKYLLCLPLIDESQRVKAIIEFTKFAPFQYRHENRAYLLVPFLKNYLITIPDLEKYQPLDFNTIESFHGLKRKSYYQYLTKMGTVSTGNILITGEPGTGKIHLAKKIHQHCYGPHEQLHIFNFKSLSDEHIQSILSQDLEKVASESGGTILFQNIDYLDYKWHIELSNRITYLPQRIMTTTSIELILLVQEKVFHESLYYKLGEIHLRVPSLEEFQSEIPSMARELIHEQLKKRDREIIEIPHFVLRLFSEKSWVLNFKELNKFIKKIFVMSETHGQDIIELLEKELAELPVLERSLNLQLNSLNITESYEKIALKQGIKKAS